MFGLLFSFMLYVFDCVLFFALFVLIVFDLCVVVVAFVFVYVSVCCDSCF